MIPACGAPHTAPRAGAKDGNAQELLVLLSIMIPLIKTRDPYQGRPRLQHN